MDDTVKKILSDVIEAEDKANPLFDTALIEILNQKGYSVSRRSIGRFRERLGIPSARFRGQLFFTKSTEKFNTSTISAWWMLVKHYRALKNLSNRDLPQGRIELLFKL